MLQASVEMEIILDRRMKVCVLIIFGQLLGKVLTSSSIAVASCVLLAFTVRCAVGVENEMLLWFMH